MLLVTAESKLATDSTLEQQIQADIDRLRSQFPDTQALYREACVLLFFRFGITPTANRLYQFVRKGSMSAPAQALGKFWQDLREKSRIRIEHPDLPEDLTAAAGELTAALWNRAQAAAQEGLAAHRAEAEAAVLEAKGGQAGAEAARDGAERELAAAQASLLRAGEQIQALERRLAAEGAARQAQADRLEEAAEQARRLQSSLDQARHEFAAELEKQRAALQLADERFRAAEARALLEIDRERTTAARLQKDLDQARTSAVQSAEQHRRDLAELQAERGQLRQQAGILEGNLQAAAAARDRLAAELDGVRARLTEAISQAATLRVEADNWRARAEEANGLVAQLQARAGRRTRKTEPESGSGKLL